MDTILYIIAGLLFLVLCAAHIYVRLKLKAGYNDDLDDCFYKVENHHSGIERYNKLSRITFALASLGALLLFIAAVI